MAESLLLPLVRSVAGKAANTLVEAVTRMCGLDNDRRALERQLLAVEYKLARAEERSKTNTYIKSWRKELKSVAYEAGDVLDDFQYEALRRQSKIGKSTTCKALRSSPPDRPPPCANTDTKLPTLSHHGTAKMACTTKKGSRD
uniref:Disease resistance N-terminal domain-containing protein n=1 Tax=Aegilops tauschii TaxID=37682 RepID=N1R103_AEGTA